MGVNFSGADDIRDWTIAYLSHLNSNSNTVDRSHNIIFAKRLNNPLTYPIPMAKKKTVKKKQGGNLPKAKKIASPEIRHRKRQAILFIVLFTVQIILFYILYGNPWFESIFFVPLANTYAWLSGKFLTIIGYSSIVIGDIISSDAAFSVSVKKGCDAAEPMAIFLASVIAFPAKIPSKLTGIAFGLSILFLLNILRVATLFIAGFHFPDLFETMHLAVWQVLFIMAAIALWFFWIHKMAVTPTAK